MTFMKISLFFLSNRLLVVGLNTVVFIIDNTSTLQHSIDHNAGWSQEQVDA